ncbi:MAG: hypothetical protein E6661_07005 [Enterobacter sp.]|uniref:hypothetical protein n=1 Tax=Enterobacter TaxID=547 RepID=UPI0012B6B73D|nr:MULTISPECIES: hypothetical protein [Enterobacter]MCC7577971.1 hypothetical protein [Enterobacter roggenkampii]MCC7586883.1 hypothetical protein [Enterobacter roggenkampii]MCC7591895.1 hypothetical protein [Enterobacter roggenkampii]MCC7601511.1 hypothetical protein [Enterobacter roggenkampii]MCC7606111.1 hypothetical protein [Enterobacter roggenkampii]
MHLKSFILAFGQAEEGDEMFAEYGDDIEDDEDDDFDRVPRGQECDHCDKVATHALGDHYYCDDHYGD